jgi:hypothetical protein
VVHALAQIASFLQPKGNSQRAEKAVAPRAVQLDYGVGGRGDAQRVQDETRVQSPRAPCAEAGNQARLGFAGWFRENDDHR